MMKLFEKYHPSKKDRDPYGKHKILVADLTHSLQLSFLHWVKVILSEIK